MLFVTNDNTYINLVDDEGNYYLYNINEEAAANCILLKSL